MGSSNFSWDWIYGHLAKRNRGFAEPARAAAAAYAHAALLLVLPFSGEEVQNGCGILGGETLIGRAATARAVLGRAASARIVHFATHAAALPDGSLRLEAVDTSVSLPEIEQLHLAADLVMLSACETARGNYMAGEGVASLARGFTVAGAHGLTANLWSVSDRASGKLLAAFFTHLKEGKRKPEALRLAKLDYLAETSTNAAALPYFWASMVYFGNESPLEATLAPNSSPPHLARIFWATLTVIWLLTMLICGYFYARSAAK